MANVKGYSGIQIALHWGILLLLVVSYFSSDAMKSAWSGLHQGRDNFGTVAAAHVWVGVTVLALMAMRVGLRLLRGAPGLPEGGNPKLDKIAKLTHLGLYVILILLPVAGLSAWFGGVEAAGDVHEILFNLGMALVVLHTAGAFYHQLVLKDGLMARMKRPG